MPLPPAGSAFLLAARCQHFYTTKKDSDRMPTLHERRAALNDTYSEASPFLSDVMHAGINGYPNDKLSPLRASAGSDEHSTISNSYGGFLVPRGFVPDMFGAPSDIDSFTGKTAFVKMEQSEVDVPAWVSENHATSVSGGLRTYRTIETQEIPSSRIKMERTTLHAHDMFSLVFASNQLIGSSPRSFSDLLLKAFHNQVGGELYAEKLVGNGVGQFLGALHSPSTITITKEMGQAAGTIVGDNIVKMKARAFRYNECHWIACNDTVEQLESATVTDSSGNSKFLLQGDQLAGRPIVFTEFLPTVGTKGDLMLVNPTQFVTGVYHPLVFTSSVHVRFLSDESAFLFWVSGDFQPLWRVPLTPRNGSATLSPSIVLEARE